MTDTQKPPMVLQWQRTHPSTDLDGNIIQENGIATTSSHPLMLGETYVHLDQFLAEVEKRAKKASEKYIPPDRPLMGYWRNYAMQELAKELKEGNVKLS